MNEYKRSETLQCAYNVKYSFIPKNCKDPHPNGSTMHIWTSCCFWEIIEDDPPCNEVYCSLLDEVVDSNNPICVEHNFTRKLLEIV